MLDKRSADLRGRYGNFVRLMENGFQCAGCTCTAATRSCDMPSRPAKIRDHAVDYDQANQFTFGCTWPTRPTSKAMTTSSPVRAAGIRASSACADAQGAATWSALSRSSAKKYAPFTEKQIALVRTSPPRRSSPSRTRGCSMNCVSARRSHESLEQQTATSEVLKVISRSPGDLEPVFPPCCEMRRDFVRPKFTNLYR